MLLDFLVRRAHHQFACLGGALFHGRGIFFGGLLVPRRAALTALRTVFLRLFRFAAFGKVQAAFCRFGYGFGRFGRTFFADTVAKFAFGLGLFLAHCENLLVFRWETLFCGMCGRMGKIRIVS